MLKNIKLLWSVACLLFTACQSSGILIDTRDGQKYHYVEINEHYWLAENMRYNVEGSKLNPNNPNLLYGRLYNWHQAKQACPEGWYMPLDVHFYDVERFCINNEELLFTKKKFRGNATILKSNEGWTPPGTDSLGLNILPAGRADDDGFDYLGTTAFFWTGDSHMFGGEFTKRFAYYRYLDNDSLGIEANSHEKNNNYYSCRCIKHIPKKENED